MTEPTDHLTRVEGEYGFAVKQGLVSRSTDVRFDVYLPHSCDEWSVAQCATRADALASLDAFIADAQSARALLAATPDLIVESHAFDPGESPLSLNGFRGSWIYACHAIWADGQRCSNRASFEAGGERLTGQFAPDYVCRRATPPREIEGS